MKQRLSLPENPFIKDYELPKNLYLDKGNRYFPIDKKYLNNETSSLFKSLGLEVGGIIVFKKHQFGISPIHTDILLEKKQWTIWNAAVNYNLTKSRSKMMWFETSLNKVYPIHTHSYQPLDYYLSGIHYGKQSNKDYRDSSFKLLDEEDIQAPTLVRTDVPHTTINLDNIDRICASVRFKNNYTFDELKKKFKEFLI